MRIIKPIIFTVIVVVLFFVALDVLVRVYLVIKNKEPQYFQFHVQINWDTPKYIAPEMLKLKAKR